MVERVSEEQSMTDALIYRDPDILGGPPVFHGTWVAVRILIECQEAGDRLDEFPENHPLAGSMYS